MTAHAGTPSADPGWDLSFLRVGAAVTAVAAGVGAIVTGVLAGWPDAMGVLVGAALVAAFFVVSGVVIAWAGKIADTFTLPAALGMFFVKALVLFGVLNALPEEGWLDRRTLAWTVVVGALLWSGVQLRWVWTRQIYYVTPPAPVGAAAQDRGKAPEHG
jgi:xanthine/uracil/vitamin C permease (AzgA family)